MKIADCDVLILPGLGNPGPGHWQTRWASRIGTARVVEQRDWDNPDRNDWIERIARAARLGGRPVVMIAHSLSVMALVQAATLLPETVRGAFLVSPPDLEENPAVPEPALVFSPIPRDPLPFPSMLVASTNDPLCTIERAVDFATCWGSDFHVAGEAGHINEASGHGPWPEGLLMFTRLMQRL